MRRVTKRRVPNGNSSGLVLRYRVYHRRSSTRSRGLIGSLGQRPETLDIVPTMSHPVVTLIPEPSTTPGPRGQAFVEFAILLPLIMLTLMGIIQFGLMLSAYVGATNVAREVARYGSVCVVKDAASASSCGSDTLAHLNNILPQRINAATPVPAQTSVTYCSYVAPKSDPTDPHKYNIRLTVNLAIRYPLFIPLIGNIIDGLDGEPGDAQFRLRASEAMRVEGTGLAVAPGTPAACA